MYCYPVYYIPYYYQPYLPPRQYPPVDPTQFFESANEMKMLMQDASVVLDRMADSREFTEKVMSAAQESKTDEVEQLIKSTGISSDVEISFNPDALKLEFIAMTHGAECCRLLVTIRWR